MYCFLFAYWNCCDCFYDGLMPDIPLKSNSSITTEYHYNFMASSHRESNLLGWFWQIKNDTLAGSFGFVGNKMAFTIGK